MKNHRFAARQRTFLQHAFPRRVALLAYSILLAFTGCANAHISSDNILDAPARTRLPPSVLAALQRADVPISAISVVIEQIGKRTPLIAWNADRPMLPASTMKLITTYSGLSILGQDYRWRTNAYTDGVIDKDGTLQGNLYIKGTGDPKLVPEELIDLVDKIRSTGIARIEGALVLDKSYFAPSTRHSALVDNDTSAPYNVGPDPLLYAFKALSFTVTPTVGGSATVDVLPHLDHLTINNQLTENHGSCNAARPALSANKDGMLVASFTGGYPLSCGPKTTHLAVLDHTAFFARGFIALWQQAGGTFNGSFRDGEVPASARPIAIHRSPVLANVVHDINKFSNNVMARNLFLTIGAVAGKPPATTEQSQYIISTFLRHNGLPMPELVLDNGSGLSRNERMSAASMANLLQAANASPIGEAFVDSLPIVGIDGTMKNRLKDQPVLGNARIKTGTLRDVRAIAGYVASADGASYVVVSFINNGRAEYARAAHDALLAWLYAGAH